MLASKSRWRAHLAALICSGQLLALARGQGVVEHVARRADAAADAAAFELLDLGDDEVVCLVLQAFAKLLDLRLRLLQRHGGDRTKRLACRFHYRLRAFSNPHLICKIHDLLRLMNGFHQPASRQLVVGNGRLQP